MILPRRKAADYPPGSRERAPKAYAFACCAFQADQKFAPGRLRGDAQDFYGFASALGSDAVTGMDSKAFRFKFLQLPVQ